MDVRWHDSVADFRASAVDVYRDDPVTATVELMVLSGRLVDRNPAPLLITVWSGGKAVGAAFQTLHSPLLCSGLPERTIASAVARISTVKKDLGSVRGPHGIVASFAAAWQTATGALGTVRIRERLHRLDGLHSPAGVAGEARRARPADKELLHDWLSRFRAEALGQLVDSAADPGRVRTAKEPPNEFLLWTVAGDPVSLAGVRLPILGVSRIGPVYTPPEMRGHGYGSAVTAAAADWAIAADAGEVVLFTDPENPASNAAYRRIGFQPVSDFARIDFPPGNR
ncbi:GNAT family N-acetyltransferase [Mycobacterium spongiae]|uniref:GNAT family N-acetyltransferase n=1 Tax=Mycobacterium spongiae TaxID=886343 RepID=A0A975PXH5_9MYCO|nr:GNAT family N-acetyltransferase [Mycobacterium spongiae]QUR68261.1 GNAT family N-acetyltransferase [Mycobacterium spongiae]